MQLHEQHVVALFEARGAYARQLAQFEFEVVKRIKQVLPQLQASLPAAIDVRVLTDRTITIRASVRDVRFELLLAVALVVMVMFLFLRNLSATIILSVAVVKALLVAIYFMRLKWDWGRLYFLIIPALVLAPMLVFALLPDIVLYWHTLASPLPR